MIENPLAQLFKASGGKEGFEVLLEEFFRGQLDCLVMALLAHFDDAGLAEDDAAFRGHHASAIIDSRDCDVIGLALVGDGKFHVSVEIGRIQASDVFAEGLAGNLCGSLHARVRVGAQDKQFHRSASIRSDVVDGICHAGAGSYVNGHVLVAVRIEEFRVDNFVKFAGLHVLAPLLSEI